MRVTGNVHVEHGYHAWSTCVPTASFMLVGLHVLWRMIDHEHQPCVSLLAYNSLHD